MNKNRSLAEKLPFWHFHNNYMVFADGSLGCGFKLEGLDITCSEEEKINELSRNIENLFISLSQGMRFQIFYKMTNDVGELLDTHEKIMSDAPEIYTPITKARTDFLRTPEARGNDYFIPQIYFFIRSKSLSYRKRKFLEKENRFKKATQEQFYNHENNFLREVKQIKSSLKHIGLSPTILSNQKYFSLCAEFLNFSRSKSIGLPELKESNDFLNSSLSSSLCLSDLIVNKDHIKIGELLFRTITLKNLPDGFTYASMAEEISKLHFHVWISQSGKVLDQATEKEALQLKRRVANAMAMGSGKINDLESENKLEQLESLLNELIEGTQKLVLMDLTTIVWAKNIEELNEKTDEVLKAYRDMNQAEGVVESLACLDVFLNAMPSVCTGFRYQKVKSSNLAHLAPLYGPWLGDSRPVCLIPTRENALFSFAPFCNKFPNYSGLIFGPSGSGKSFTICQLMLMFYGQSPTPRLYWIDNGASSQNLLEVLDGEFIDLKLDCGICLNPFALDPDSSEVSNEKVKMALTVLEMILKDEHEKNLPKRIKALLEESIFKLYQKNKDSVPTLSGLKEILDNHEDLELRKYAQILYSWTGNTSYGKLLDGKTNIKLSKDIVTIEVQSLNDYPDLKDIVLILLTSFIQKEAMRELERPTLLIVDEAERLFKTEMAKQFVITCYRTWRKYNAGIYCISQNYRDFMMDEEIRNALLPNSTNIFILRQKKIDWQEFQRVFDFNDAQIDAIKSLDIVKGEFSEMFLIQDDKETILKLVSEPLSYWISTSDGNDKIKISEMKKKFPEKNKIEILQELAGLKTE